MSNEKKSETWVMKSYLEHVIRVSDFDTLLTIIHNENGFRVILNENLVGHFLSKNIKTDRKLTKSSSYMKWLRLKGWFSSEKDTNSTKFNPKVSLNQYYEGESEVL